MTTAESLYLAFGVMTLTTGLKELCMWKHHKQTYKFCVKYFLCVKTTDIMRVQNFKVIFNKFKVDGICANGNYRKKIDKNCIIINLQYLQLCLVL